MAKLLGLTPPFVGHNPNGTPPFQTATIEGHICWWCELPAVLLSFTYPRYLSHPFVTFETLNKGDIYFK